MMPKMRISYYITAILFLSAVLYCTNAETTLADLPDKMNQFGKFLQTIQGRIKKAENANPQIGLIMKRTMLAEISEKREQIDQIDQMIREVLNSGSMSREDRVEMELHLYNCDTFRDLSNSAMKQIKQMLKAELSNKSS